MYSIYIVIILTLTLPATLLMKHRPSVHSTPCNKYMKLNHLNATTWLLALYKYYASIV